ncbi:transposase [Mangrovibacterium marinum]|uniref:ISAon1 family transposase n=1 Tax=Mangrovibacterium marinum TaxID=1639118 RepID=UPI002A18A94D|nr:transposase [Mangrovibacterium marinum]
MDSFPISSNSLEKFYAINGNQFSTQYKDHLSDYNHWDQKDHAPDWLLFPDNIGPHLSIDETALSQGELYTIITNKAAKGRKGALVAMIKGTKAEDVTRILMKIPHRLRRKVEEITLDMAASMNQIVSKCFTRAVKVIDRFHVQKLAYDALQEMRIAHRWDAINEEPNALDNARWEKKTYCPFRFANGDTKKQLLARSRYLLFKSAEKWTSEQKQRATILFAQYPDIKEAYDLTHRLRLIFSKTQEKGVALTKLAHWYDQVTESGFKSFNTISATIYTHYTEILNFFENRSTNASAESFNAKLKSFRACLRGVNDTAFFLYRISKIYA